MSSYLSIKIHNLFIVLIGLILITSNTLLAAAPQELVILTWSEYMDPELVKQFESQNNASIKFVYFESDELRDDMLVNADGTGFDIICSNGRSVKTYVKRGWLEPISEQQMPNRKHLDPRWLNAFTHTSEYAVPFFWGTEGIAYRKDLVKTPITSWKQLLKPAAELQGKIVLVKDARDLMMTALKSLGQSINTTDPKILKQAEDLLLAQKPYVKDYSYIALTEESALVRGTAVAAIAYSGDALVLAEHDENITYVVPEEGTALWVDYLVVSKSSKRKKLAMDFLNYINEPEVAAQLAEFVYYASPNLAAEKHLPVDFLNDPVIYPDKSIIDRGEFYLELPPRTQRSYNNILPQIVGE
jgi:spermidine/putrescine transport system substrate-binding protein